MGDARGDERSDSGCPQTQGENRITLQFHQIQLCEAPGYVEEFLMDQGDDAWPRYVDRNFVREAVCSPSPTTDSQMLVVCGCIGYTLWREYWAEARRSPAGE